MIPNLLALVRHDALADKWSFTVEFGYIWK